MKIASFIALLFLAAVSVLSEGCCKSYCVDDDIFAIDFQGFTPVDMQKIKVVSYSQDNLTNAIDSYYVSSNNIIVKDTTRVYLDKPLHSHFSFRIAVENAGLDYTITNFKTQKEDCNCGPGTYKRIAGFNLNGSLYAGVEKQKLDIKK